MTSHEDAVARLACAWLLWYPDDRMFERLPDIRAALAELPAQTRDPLTAFLGWLDEQDRKFLANLGNRTEQAKLRIESLESRRAVLDQRRIDRLKPFYRARAEFFEFAAIGDRLTGDALLAEHVGAIGLLHSALESMGSPYALVVEAVIATLPAITPEIADRMAAIATQGPPSEQVGLEPFTIGTEEVRR